MNAPEPIVTTSAAPTAPVASSPPTAVTSVAADAIAAAPPVVASADAKRIAGAILEVLAGVRSITDAAVAIGVSPARYYQLEARALAGLIGACEPRPPGRAPGAGLPGEIERLRSERDRLREEAARYQALARIAQSAFGPSPAQTAATAAVRAAAAARAVSEPKPRRRRTATVRALKLARHVQGERPSAVLPSAASTAPTTRGNPAPDQAGG